MSDLAYLHLVPLIGKEICFTDHEDIGRWGVVLHVNAAIMKLRVRIIDCQEFLIDPEQISYVGTPTK